MESVNLVTDSAALTAEPLAICDLGLRSVRVLRRRDNGFVEFEFSVGWPDLMVELTMMEADFQEFCKTQHVHLL